MSLPHDKASLIAYIQALPDELVCADFALGATVQTSDIFSEPGEWRVGKGYDSFMGMQYTRKVENTMKFTLRFKTEDEGWFKRTSEEPDGRMRAIRRIL